MNSLFISTLRFLVWCLFLTLGLNSHGQKSKNQSGIKDSLQGTFDVKQISFTEWDTTDKRMLDKIPILFGDEVMAGFNFGSTSFQVLNDSSIAFLAVSNEIIIINIKSRKTIKRFPVAFAGADNFFYDKELFFVLGGSASGGWEVLIVYDIQGKEVNRIAIPQQYAPLSEITRYENSTYLLDFGKQKSIQIESGGMAAVSQEYEGIITTKGDFIQVLQEMGSYHYTLKVSRPEGKVFHKIFFIDEALSGASFIGATKDRIFLNLWTTSPSKKKEIEREAIVAIHITSDGIGKIIAAIDIPESLYGGFVYPNREYFISPERTLFQMVTTADGVYIFRLTESLKGKETGYPKLYMISNLPVNQIQNDK